MKHFWSIIAAAVASIVIILGFGFVKYQSEYHKRLKELDRDLRSAALAANFIVGSEFHTKTLNENSYDAEQDRNLASRLTEYAISQDFKYVYTMILDNGVIRFTSSSYTPEEIAGGPYETFYWTTYDEADPALFDVFHSGKPTYVNYSDRWGDFRSFFVFYPNPIGRDYVIGVDVNLSELAHIRHKAIKETLVLLGVITMLLALWIWTSTKQQAAIILSNRRYNIALSVASIGIWEWDISKKSFYISPAFFLSLGYSIEQTPTTLEEIHALIHPDDVDAFRRSMHEALTRNAPDQVYIDFELRMQNAMGEYISMRTQGKTVKWRKNGVAALRSGVIENVNALKITQAELIESRKSLVQRERFLNTLLASLPDFVGFKNSDGIYSAVSNTFEQLFGHAPSELLGKTDFDFVPFHIAELFRQNDLKAMSSPLPIRVEEWVIFASDDKPHLLETFKTRIVDEENNLLGVLSIGRNITERHELITELQKFQRFAEYSGQGLCMVSLSANLDYMNPLFKQLVCPTKNISENLSLYSFYPTQTSVFLRTTVFPQVIKGETWKGELPMINSVGKEMPTLQAFFAILNEQGITMFIGVTVTDISEQKAFEYELASAKENAEIANQSKSAFLANMSHEIRTPMNAVLGYTQLLLSNELPVEVRDQLDHIYQAGQRLLSLINDILDLSKIEAGKIKVNAEAFYLRRELQQIVQLMRKQISGKEVDILEELELPDEANITSDRKKIGQIVMNLLSNAIKFTRQGNITLLCTYDNVGIRVVVEDTGQGISKDDQKRLFEPFTQGSEGEKSGGGTGLGLVLSRKLAEQLGGHLTLESVKGKGTKVSLFLPEKVHFSAITMNTNKELGDQVLDENSRCKTLIIDDDLDSRRVLSGLLSAIGCDVISAESGAEALDLLNIHCVDIVLTDIRMPGISGIDLLNRIRAADEELMKTLPVVAVTASTLEHESNYFLSLGFDDFVSKPVIRSELVRVLKSHTQATFLNSKIELKKTEDSDELRLTTADLSDGDKKILIAVKGAGDEGDPAHINKLMERLSDEFQRSINYKELTEAVRRYDFILLEKKLNELLV